MDSSEISNRMLPFKRMLDRVEIARDNSDDDYFNSLMYFGELLTKLTTLGMVAAVSNERERQQYRLKQHLVRADGIGDWAQVIDEVLTGVPAQYLLTGAYVEAQELNQRQSAGTWQYECFSLIHSCLQRVHPNVEKLANKIAVKNWFSIFATLRNKTRGHGAIPSGKLAALNSDLFDSIILFVDEFSLFKRGWAYLVPTVRGKYRVTKWNDYAESLGFLKSRDGSHSINLEEGVYIHFGIEPHLDSIMQANLVYSDADVADIYIANGAFNTKRFSAVSYISGNTIELDSKPYLLPVTDLPPSETEGLHELQQASGSIINLPPAQKGYITRATPEHRLYEELTEDNQHRIITLVGRGGIGKTWLALKVLNQIAEEGMFDAILWFSARDIDLLSDGAKQVKPHILNQQDIAEEFTRLIGPFLLSFNEITSKDFDKSEFLRTNMRSSELGKILFVFDNFETVKSPGELFTWIDTYLRLPNKCLITTRFRDFKGDYPVELLGMSTEESHILINRNASAIGVTQYLTDDYVDELIAETGGHPYIIKMLLTELKKVGRPMKVERILLRQDNVLDVLFERTFSRLSVAAQRVFLTLCNWKSFISQLALEAVLFRPENEQMDVEQAIDDLYNSSLIDKSVSPTDEEVFLSVPLVAMQFGQRKLSVSGMRMAILADTELLQFFGAAQAPEVKQGIEPRVKNLIRSIEQNVRKSSADLEQYLPILEFVARRYSPAWLAIANLHFKNSDSAKGEDMLKRFLEFSSDVHSKRQVWYRLIALYSQQHRYLEELAAHTELAQLPDTDYEIISSATNRLNALLKDGQVSLNNWEKSQYAKALIDLMEARIAEATATDCSRLGWLYIHYGDRNKAYDTAYQGLERDPDNEYCSNLIRTLNGGS